MGRTIEFRASAIDEYGDAQDWSHYPTQAEAIALAEALLAGGAVAAVVERVTRAPRDSAGWPMGADVAVLTATMGDEAALEAGDWRVEV